MCDLRRTLSYHCLRDALCPPHPHLLRADLTRTRGPRDTVGDVVRLIIAHAGLIALHLHSSLSLSHSAHPIVTHSTRPYSSYSSHLSTNDHTFLPPSLTSAHTSQPLPNSAHRHSIRPPQRHLNSRHHDTRPRRIGGRRVPARHAVPTHKATETRDGPPPVCAAGGMYLSSQVSRGQVGPFS